MLKTCNKCLETKPLEGFYLTGRKPISQCKLCIKRLRKEYYSSNKNTIIHKVLAWRARNPESVKRFALKSYHKTKRKKYDKRNAYRRAHPEIVSAERAVRRSAVLRAVQKWANKFFISEIYDLARRRTQATGFQWHVDHIVPLKSSVVCGLHVEHNLQVIPGMDNYRKSNTSWPNMP